MRTQQKDKGRNALAVMTKENHTAMHKEAAQDIEKVARVAGAEVLKTVRIAIQFGMERQQAAGMKELNKLLQDIRVEKDRESVVVQTGIATGYANAMHHFDLISESELNDVIEVIGQAGERATSRIEAASMEHLNDAKSRHKPIKC